MHLLFTAGSSKLPFPDDFHSSVIQGKIEHWTLLAGSRLFCGEQGNMSSRGTKLVGFFAYKVRRDIVISVCHY